MIIAAWVILFDIVIKAMLPDISRALGPYVGLIITNCIIMGRAEAFAQSNPPVESFLDGVFAGLGYTAVLIVIRLYTGTDGFGTILGFNVNFLGLQTWTIMVMPRPPFLGGGRMYGSSITLRPARKLLEVVRMGMSLLRLALSLSSWHRC